MPLQEQSSAQLCGASTDSNASASAAVRVPGVPTAESVEGDSVCDGSSSDEVPDLPQFRNSLGGAGGASVHHLHGYSAPPLSPRTTADFPVELPSKLGPGDFDILRLVGQGAFGKVWRLLDGHATDPQYLYSQSLNLCRVLALTICIA